MTSNAITGVTAGIEATGPERSLLSTDHGLSGRISPPEALGAFHGDLGDAGTPSTDIERMAHGNLEGLFG